MRLTRRQILTPARIRVERMRVPKATDPFPTDTCCAMRLTGGSYPNNCGNESYYPTQGVAITLGVNGPTVRICGKHTHWMSWRAAKPRPATCPGCHRRVSVFQIASEGGAALSHALCAQCFVMVQNAIGKVTEQKDIDACEMEAMHPEVP